MTYDPINRPAHYAAGRRFEVIEVIEDWSQFAPDVKQGIALGAALKYLGRLWTKNDGITSSAEMNLRKAQWYLDRLMQHMIDAAPEHPVDPGDLDYGDDMPWDRIYSMSSAAKTVGLEGGIGDEDPTDAKAFYEEVLGYTDFEFHVDVDKHRDTWTA